MTTPTAPDRSAPNTVSVGDTRDWLHSLGFREEPRTGWLLKLGCRVSLPAPGKVNFCQFSPDEGYWFIRTDGAPRWALEAMIKSIAERGA